MRAALAELSRDDTLFFCARINGIVSGFSPNRSIVARQQRVLIWLCTPAEIDGRRTLPGIDPNPPLANDRFRAAQFVDIAATAGEITPLKSGSTPRRKLEKHGDGHD